MREGVREGEGERGRVMISRRNGALKETRRCEIKTDLRTVEECRTGHGSLGFEIQS